jgi:DNA repair protein RecO (recombination protein O)
MIVKTDAIVLRSRKYRETSKILNLYTKEFGKLSVIAKGARGPKSKFGAALQPMNHVCAVLYKHDQRELHLLSQCDGITRFPNLTEDLDKFAAAMSIMELLEFVAHDEERNDQLFDLALGSLRAINEAPKNARNIQYYFELHLSDVLGFRPNFHTCLSCGKHLDAEHVGTKGGELRLGNGGVLCSGCSENAVSRVAISFGALRILQRFQETTESGNVTQTKLTEHQMEEVGTMLRQYLESHVGGLHKLKAQSVAASIG